MISFDCLALAKHGLDLDIHAVSTGVVPGLLPPQLMS